MFEAISNHVCSYCGSLSHAISGDHNCSITGVVHPEDSLGNSFYVKTRQLSSETHTSRLSFRSVLRGYQSYSVGDKDYLLNSGNYLVIPEGTRYRNQIETPRKTESIVVVFGESVQREVEAVHLKSEEFLLDNPDFLPDEYHVDFYQSTYKKDADIDLGLKKIKLGIKSGDKDPLFFQQVQYELMILMLRNHLGTSGFQHSNKMSTVNELYKRTRLALDHIEAHFDRRLTINHLSNVASLSPFHFIRTFKLFYGMTPGEYLGQTRLKYAEYLLKNSDIPITEIISSVGFKNHSSFSRMFKNYFGSSPSVCRSDANKSKIRTIIQMQA